MILRLTCIRPGRLSATADISDAVKVSDEDAYLSHNATNEADNKIGMFDTIIPPA